MNLCDISICDEEENIANGNILLILGFQIFQGNCISIT